ncbi:WXG100 family type VII secretion target [Arthrobacter luteolus]|uniref:WXG100 family type VII secretion target n=1 Tax=Arthrobacter luteolus TaxID=98672 RepID=UPI00384EDDB9
MSIDTSMLYGWCSPDAVENAAPTLKKSGEAYLQSVEQAKSTWQQLGSHYSGDGATEILDAFENVMPNARMLEDSAGAVSSALTEFASSIRALESRRSSLIARVEAAEIRAANELAAKCTADQAYTPPPAATADLLLPAEVSALAAQYRALEEETAAKVRSAFHGDGGLLGLATGIPATVLYGMAAKGISATTARQTVTKVPTPIPVYRRYQTAEERIRHMARGRWITDGEWKLTTVFGFDLRPNVYRGLYNHSGWYRNRVSANPSNWVLPDKFKDLGTAAKGIKVSGGVFTAVTAGFTIAGEREDAYNELLQANPGWSRDELNGRANLEGGVKGGTKAGIDIGAAGAGALIGTAIGGPVGTVVGAFIGIGISAVTSIEFDSLGGRTLKDVAADGVMDAVDSFAKGWDKLFGG